VRIDGVNVGIGNGQDRSDALIDIETVTLNDVHYYSQDEKKQ
jgi:hypothetical protein